MKDTQRLVAYADWEAVGDFSAAARPGDYVEARIVEEMRDCLPPIRMDCGYLQVGEPYSHAYHPRKERWCGTYATFRKVGQQWQYCGNCFVGETAEPEK